MINIPVGTEELVRSRQSELVSDEIFKHRISIIGCGAIGSFTALTLAKMGFKTIEVFDHDNVNTENISNQFYRYSDIGTNKATALRRMIQDFEGIEVMSYGRWSRGEYPLDRGYIVMAVDSMNVRGQIFEAVKSNRHIEGFVDGRMGGQQAEIYSINAKSRAEKAIYSQYLWAEDEASELPCTQKAVMYNVLWIASGIANSLRLMMEGKPYHNVTLMDFENGVQRNVVQE